MAVHLATELSIPWHFIIPLIPEKMESWGKVRVHKGGDFIRTHYIASNQMGRDQSFVRVSRLFVINLGCLSWVALLV